MRSTRFDGFIFTFGAGKRRYFRIMSRPTPLKCPCQPKPPQMLSLKREKRVPLLLRASHACSSKTKMPVKKMMNVL